MANTYPEETPIEIKFLEELRCIRSVLERLLRVQDEGLFVDYQMEKFGKKLNLIGKKIELICPECNFVREIDLTMYIISLCGGNKPFICPQGHAMERKEKGILPLLRIVGIEEDRELN